MTPLPKGFDCSFFVRPKNEPKKGNSSEARWQNPKPSEFRNFVFALFYTSELAEGKCAKLMALRPSRIGLAG